jgi:hypothetical protein
MYVKLLNETTFLSGLYIGKNKRGRSVDMMNDKKQLMYG